MVCGFGVIVGGLFRWDCYCFVILSARVFVWVDCEVEGSDSNAVV